MKPDLMEILCCPVCKGDLTLTTTKKDGPEIVVGNLHCAKCKIDYPIEDGIPNLLPPEDRD
ncbi:MAG: methytransferase partner Trm112 [Thermoplasmata archaeon]|nr:methytransferase partner Trm112 [Thermoplasmata archaeon]MCI4357107.1 methytransferase partner Trm112 [Thermoplasmata archaeon]